LGDWDERQIVMDVEKDGKRGEGERKEEFVVFESIEEGFMK
jgi:hypothetical protein